ncbi:MAG TPA: D-2-hydroxyacid dehydrogenase [Microbacteriaceae bacterium]
MADKPVTVMIATPFEDSLVQPLSEVDDRVSLLYRPDLLPPVRYPGDHRGIRPFHRDPEAERAWDAMLSRAEVLLGIPGDSPENLAAVVRDNPDLRWVQATAAGAGEQVKAAALSMDERDRVTVTSTSGVHAGPLAEFAMLGLLSFAKDLPRLLADQRDHRWDHYPVAELAGHTLLVVGLGAIGVQVARRAKAMNMHIIGVNRRGTSSCPDVDETHATEDLPDLLPRADAVVFSLPLTEKTEGMIDAEALRRLRRLRRLRPEAILVNVGRGAVIDEPGLVDALAQRRLAGAALDVFTLEPLPDKNPLWDLPNVLISPHTTGLSLNENKRIIDLFTANLRHYLNGEELTNTVDTTVFY